jgi:hypothetical protein
MWNGDAPNTFGRFGSLSSAASKLTPRKLPFVAADGSFDATIVVEVTGPEEGVEFGLAPMEWESDLVA